MLIRRRGEIQEHREKNLSWQLWDENQQQIQPTALSLLRKTKSKTKSTTVVNQWYIRNCVWFGLFRLYLFTILFSCLNCYYRWGIDYMQERNELRSGGRRSCIKTLKGLNTTRKKICEDVYVVLAFLQTCLDAENIISAWFVPKINFTALQSFSLPKFCICICKTALTSLKSNQTSNIGCLSGIDKRDFGD